MMMREKPKVLYLSYDGILDPLGQSQIIPYLKQLSEKGITYTLLTFEKKFNLLNKEKLAQVRHELANLKIEWKVLKYHRCPLFLAKFWDILVGLVYSIIIVRQKRINFVHARSYIASLSAIILKKLYKVYFIFDMRGFWVDERAEVGTYHYNSFPYRVLKYFEKIFFTTADVIVSLTDCGADEIRDFDYMRAHNTNITVIPTCVDLQRFNLNHAIEGELSEGIEKFHGKFLLVYSGSLSTWFMPNEMLIFFEILKKNIMDAHFLILTPEKTLLKNILENKKLYRDSISVLNVDHQSVPRYLMQAKAGMVFYRQGYSNKGRSPTKVGEYLACGLPVIINRDIGDSEEIIKKEGVGFIIEEFSNSEYERVSGQLKKALLDLDSLRQKCFATARKYYSLDQGVEKYWQVYQGLLKR